MTRIFEALRKAESSRERSPAQGPAPLSPHPAPEPTWARAPGTASLALPLIGGVDLAEDALRETTALRVSLEGALPDRATRSIMFTSAQGGEGTSTVALQFAQGLAQSSARVLYVDGNARRPVCYANETQHHAVLDPRIASAELTGVMTPHLHAVPATEEAVRLGRFPMELLRDVLQSSAGAHDWVILDGPPVVESPDAAALATQVDGVVLVLHAGRAKRPVVTRAVALLRKSGGRVLGTVLNRRIHEIPGFIYRRI